MQRFNWQRFNWQRFKARHFNTRYFNAWYLKKITAFVLSVAAAVLLAGCSPKTDNGSLLAPPGVSGDMQLVEKTLKEYVKGSYTLKYPTAGEYRSAYILADLFENGKKEFALALYSVTGADNISAMHLNLMKKVDESWVTYSDVQIAAVGVEKVDFCDLDGDGTREIVVGWNIYSNIEKKAVVYSLSGESLSAHTQEPYTEFLCGKLRQNGGNDLFILSHNADKKEAVAKVLSYENNAFRTVSSCALNGAATAFSAPQLSRLTGGTPAVFVDSTLTNGMQTEVLFFKNNQLTNPLLQQANGGQLATFRSSSAVCCDMNEDGFLDIPVMRQPSRKAVPSSAGVPQINLTDWSSYDGEQLVVTLVAAMNYTDGYYFTLPKRWEGKITVQREPESRSCAVLLQSGEQQTPTELVRIRAVAETEWGKADADSDAYFELARKNSTVFIAMQGVYNGEEAVSQTEMKSIFHLIQ